LAHQLYFGLENVQTNLGFFLNSEVSRTEETDQRTDEHAKSVMQLMRNRNVEHMVYDGDNDDILSHRSSRLLYFKDHPVVNLIPIV